MSLPSEAPVPGDVVSQLWSRAIVRAAEQQTTAEYVFAQLIAEYLSEALRRSDQTWRAYVQHKPECEAILSATFRCFGCGYVTANRAEDQKAARSCKGYCQDRECPAAWPCPACGRIHYWGGNEAMARPCTCGLAELLAASSLVGEDVQHKATCEKSLRGWHGHEYYYPDGWIQIGQHFGDGREILPHRIAVCTCGAQHAARCPSVDGEESAR